MEINFCERNSMDLVMSEDMNEERIKMEGAAGASRFETRPDTGLR